MVSQLRRARLLASPGAHTNASRIGMFRTLPYRHLVAVLALCEQAFNDCHQH
jgi:hypothetical protein